MMDANINIKKILLPLFVGLTAFGCSDGEIKSAAHQFSASPDNNAIGTFILNKPEIANNGIAKLSMVFRNESNVPICLAHKTKDTYHKIQVDIQDSKGRFFLFSQEDNEDEHLEPVSEANIGKTTPPILKPITIKSGESIGIEFNLKPLHDAYFVNSRHLYVKEFTQGTPLIMTAIIHVFDCKYKNLNDALGAGKYVSIKSNTINLV